MPGLVESRDGVSAHAREQAFHSTQYIAADSETKAGSSHHGIIFPSGNYRLKPTSRTTFVFHMLHSAGEWQLGLDILYVVHTAFGRTGHRTTDCPPREPALPFYFFGP